MSGAAEVLSRARPTADDLGSSLSDLLRDPDELTRVTAARALYKIGQPSQAALRCLIEALRGKDRWVRDSAARTVAEIGSPAAEAVMALLEAALDRSNWSPDSLLVEALAALDVTAIPALIANLGHPEWKLRATVAWALGRIGPCAVEVVPALIDALQDQNRDVRAAAAWALGKIGPGAETSVPALIHTLRDAAHGVIEADKFRRSKERDPNPNYGESHVGQAAHNALKTLTGKDFGPPAWASSTEIEEALSAWDAWWQSQPQSGSKDEAGTR
jgi:HEAT repeat protein